VNKRSTQTQSTMLVYSTPRWRHQCFTQHNGCRRTSSDKRSCFRSGGSLATVTRSLRFRRRLEMWPERAIKRPRSRCVTVVISQLIRAATAHSSYTPSAMFNQAAAATNIAHPPAVSWHGSNAPCSYYSHLTSKCLLLYYLSVFIENSKCTKTLKNSLCTISCNKIAIVNTIVFGWYSMPSSNVHVLWNWQDGVTHSDGSKRRSGWMRLLYI